MDKFVLKSFKINNIYITNTNKHKQINKQTNIIHLSLLNYLSAH